MDNRKAAQNGVITNMYMSGKLGIIGKKRVVADLSIMRQVHISHDPDAAANAG